MFRSRVLSVFLAIFIFISVFSGCGGAQTEPEASVDPHEGMVYVEDDDGAGKWVTLYENVPAASYDQSLFTSDGEYINYKDGSASAMRGIDVSSHQGSIDWAAVAADGVDFAMIRACYRGYTEGLLYEDELCRQNIENALANGIRVGLYCFSQAITEDEAKAEADLAIALAKEYDVTMPIVFDWEHIGSGETARTDGLDNALITDCCISFCKTVAEAGFTPMVYFYTSLGYEVYDLGRLAEFDFWLAEPGSAPGFYYDFSMWQYSYTAAVSGIEGNVDLNLCFKTYE